MLGKIVLTGLIVAAVFVLGRLSGQRPSRRVGAGSGPAAPRRVRDAEDLVECPRCGGFHAAEELCSCRRDRIGRS